MARAVRLQYNPKAYDEILGGAKALAAVSEKVDSIAAACNADSSWGGYFSAASSTNGRARGRVWSADNRNDEHRDQRLVRNLDA